MAPHKAQARNTNASKTVQTRTGQALNGPHSLEMAASSTSVPVNLRPRRHVAFSSQADAAAANMNTIDTSTLHTPAATLVQSHRGPQPSRSKANPAQTRVQRDVSPLQSPAKRRRTQFNGRSDDRVDERSDAPAATQVPGQRRSRIPVPRPSRREITDAQISHSSRPVVQSDDQIDVLPATPVQPSYHSPVVVIRNEGEEPPNGLNVSDSENINANNDFTEAYNNDRGRGATFNVIPNVNSNQMNVLHGNRTDVQSSGELNVSRLIEEMTNAFVSAASVLTENNERIKLKKLPSFDGNPLDWNRFKSAYEVSSARGQFSDRENSLRLFEALSGKALDLVRALFVTDCRAAEVIETLEARFGLTKLLMQKLVTNIKSFPNIREEPHRLLEFATELKTSVLAIGSIENSGLLYRTDLIDEIRSKLPNSIMGNYIWYDTDESQPDLLKISDYIYAVALHSSKSGVFVMSDTPSSRVEKRPQVPNKFNTNKIVMVTSTEKAGDESSDNKVKNACEICKRDNHKINKCFLFAKMFPYKRLKAVRSEKLCFNCLKNGHYVEQCDSGSCNVCKRKHHTLLHDAFQSKRDQPTSDQNFIVQLNSSEISDDTQKSS